MPPGGDEGTWLVLAYPWVGLASPSSVHLLSYPPMSLPFLGLAVIATGGPLSGARLFAGVVIASLGLAAFQLGRAMFRWRALALLFELALFVEPDFQQLYYFGAYPNLFGFVFFFLSVAFGLRYLRSRRDLHLAIFWSAATAALLSEALVAVILVALFAIAGIALLAVRRFPREILATWVGRAGAVSFGGFGLLYYAGGWLTGASPPNYLYTTVLTSTLSTQQLGEVFHAFYLEPISILVHLGAFSFTYAVALALLWGLSALLVVGFAVVRWRRPTWATDRAIALMSWFLAVFAVALLSWYLNLTADYRRFTYFLYPANLLLLTLFADLVLGILWVRLPATPDPAPRDRGWRRPHRAPAVGAIFALAAGGLAVGAVAYTLPAANHFEAQNTRVGHGTAFLSAMNAISSSGISGSILSLTPSVDRWPATLTGHDLYEVRPPTGYTYTANNLEVDELAALSATYHDALTNGKVVVAIPGATSATYNASPSFGYYYDGLVRPVFVLRPDSLAVSLDGAPPAPVNTTAGLPAAWIDPRGAEGAPLLVVNLTGPGFRLTESIGALPGTSSAEVLFSATPTSSQHVTGIRFDLAAGAFGGGGVVASGGPSFTWSSTPSGGALPTFGNLSAGAAATAVNGSTIAVVSSAETLALNLSTPAATNPISDVTGAIVAPDLWQSWNVRFLLVGPGASPFEQAYLQAEYGASVFASDAPWTVLVWSGVSSIGAIPAVSPAP